MFAYVCVSVAVTDIFNGVVRKEVQIAIVGKGTGPGYKG